MNKLLEPEVLNVLCAVVGAAVGWWLRQRQTPTTTPINPELAELLQLLLNRRRQQQAETLLNDLMQPAGEGKKPTP